MSLDQAVRFQALGGGHYQSSNELTVRLIVINELPIVPKNYSLLLFASSAKKFRQFLQRTVEEENWDYIHFAYRLRPQITQEVLTMAGRHRIPKKDLAFMAEDIGTEILPFLSPEDRVRGLSPEDQLRGLTSEDRLHGLSSQDLLKHLSINAQQRPLDAEERRILQQLLANQGDN